MPWSAVELDDVATFLADAGDEGLTWEAKGHERPRKEVVRRSACGFANAIGGYLMIGAERQDDCWIAPGVDFLGEEPTVWLSQIIRDSVRPVPRHDVRAWPLDARSVAVVQVEPVAVPPAMTISGEIYERVSGATVKVTDPAVLAGLFERGHAAQARAEATALRQAEQIVPGEPEPPFLILVLGVSPTGTSEDVSARLFTQTFETRLSSVFEGLPSAPLFPEPRIVAPPFRTHAAQDALLTYSIDEGLHVWRIRAAWDGSVGVALSMRVEEDDAQLLANAIFSDALRPAADAAVALVEAMGGYGRGHVVLRVMARSFRLVHNGAYRTIPGPNTLLPIRRWTPDDGQIDDELLESMKRDSCGPLAARRGSPRRKQILEEADPLEWCLSRGKLRSDGAATLRRWTRSPPT